MLMCTRERNICYILEYTNSVMSLDLPQFCCGSVNTIKCICHKLYVYRKHVIVYLWPIFLGFVAPETLSTIQSMGYVVL